VPAATRTPRRSRARRSLGGFALLGALVLVLAGCGNPGDVNDYNDQTQSNFVDACKAANGEDGLDSDELDRLCGCWYDAVVEQVDFDQFEQDDENLREAVDNNELNNDADFQRLAPTLYRVITEECVEVGPSAG
jgi:hypothetical protein